jgi:hypothetical protein
VVHGEGSETQWLAVDALNRERVYRADAVQVKAQGQNNGWIQVIQGQISWQLA